jgi:succinate-semialdehyde dehydrogenase/glutarate-semialdehyde dehydrogenase
VFVVLHGDGEVGRWMTEGDVDLVSFTGSSRTGREVAKIAAAKLTPFIAELGGSAPCIVFDDADVAGVIDTVYGNRFVNCGQSCDAIKRLIVHESRFDETIERLVALIAEAKVGSPLDETTTIGPLVSAAQRELLESQMADATEKGATVVVGGGRPDLDGAYYLPTLLVDVTSEMRVWTEEVFGPVLPVVSFHTEEEAIALANDTKFGLGAWVMTEDQEHFERVARRVESGMVTQNNVEYWSPKNPFGGYKQSGIGRLHGEYGFHEMTQVKLVTSRK